MLREEHVGHCCEDESECAQEWLPSQLKRMARDGDSWRTREGGKREIEKREGERREREREADYALPGMGVF